jgi:hypothetical protein
MVYVGMSMTLGSAGMELRCSDVQTRKVETSFKLRIAMFIIALS